MALVVSPSSPPGQFLSGVRMLDRLAIFTVLLLLSVFAGQMIGG